MKKAISILLALILCLGLCACGQDATDKKQDPDSGNNSTSTEPAVKEETEFVLCQEWKNVKSGHSVVIREDGTYSSGGSQFNYVYSEEEQAVFLDSARFDIVQQYGVYMLVFDNEEYLVSADNYEALHVIFVQNGEREIAESGTVVKLGEQYRLMCGAYFTVDRVELDQENTILRVYLLCKNGNDEGCEEFNSVKGNWTSLYLGCPFTLSTENAYVDAQYPSREICLTFESTRLTTDEIKTYSDDSYGYFKLYFSAGKESYYININEFYK